MRAVVVEEYGDPEVLRVGEVPEPTPSAGQVRVRVRAAAVNPVDLATRSGALASWVPAGASRPLVLGWDVAGTLDAVGAGVTGWSVGDEVVGMSDWFDAGVGTQAEAVVLGADVLAAAPRGVAPEVAATLPLNAQTADQALDLLDLPAGATVLVTGAAGGVGGFAVSLAAARGLEVVAVAGAADADLVTARGAAVHLPWSEDLTGALRRLRPAGVDGVLDAAVVGPSLVGAVRDAGAFVSVLDPATPAGERGVRTAKVSVRGDGERLARLARALEEGRLHTSVAEVLPFGGAAAAHARLAEGGVRGRLVLTP
ncbi:NADP-dependent oxidoreductase [Geodermatophilus sp. DSM 44513]|uniref:NADP-dependent oxidoreductase n=1 Tax=Geodermatophilus sp. DSM 44513 TaxID=1528104 RepID=UPI00127E04E0|nr:NADP-dependent oxidoreductase [Geodermatophilus sp. DSM 44513]WNV75644.1 NADP-dependent oxidoreductase [Geodermatophilus sp. DSM 44513]